MARPYFWRITRLDTGETFNGLREAGEALYAAENTVRAAIVSGKLKVGDVPIKAEKVQKGKLINTGWREVRCVETGVTYKSVAEASRVTGVHNKSIAKCANGRTKTAGGYHWRYTN